MPEINANLPRNWMSAPLGDVVDILDFQRRPINSEEREKRPGNVPYFGATGQVGWIDDYLFDEELVLLGEDGAPFLDPVKSKAYLIRGKSWVNNHAHVLKGRCGISNRFLMYQLNQVDYRRFVSGTTRLKLPQAPMKQIPLVVAPEPEQFRIVAEIEKQFTRLESGLVALKRVQANLKRYRAAVLQAAVEGRLVPSEAELARREGRSYEPAGELLARIVTQPLLAVPKKAQAGVPVQLEAEHIEPASPDATRLSRLPEGWTCAPLKLIADLKGGLTKGQKRKPTDRVRHVPYLRVANVQRGYLDLVEVKTIEATEDEIADLELLPGDVLFNEGGDRDKLGRGWVWDGQIKECIHQNHVFRARLNSERMLPKFLSWYGNSAGQRYFNDEGKQTTNLASLNMTKLGRLPVPIPPAVEQERIVAEVDRRLSVIDELEMQVEANLKRAERLRQAILKRAFEGRLVPQDPNDEPASMLLERIRHTKLPETVVNSKRWKKAALAADSPPQV